LGEEEKWRYAEEFTSGIPPLKSLSRFSGRVRGCKKVFNTPDNMLIIKH
jgi:hypothetical protein